MMLIETTDALAAFCRDLLGAPYITVDTEFMREKTYWPQLCLVQVAGPQAAAVIDPLAPGMDLSPLFAVMADSAILKVFHAARQDVEIFHHLSGHVPAPLFDTQVAAMVCGFGESVSYETLVARLTTARVDKSSRYTDWAHRPLSERQLTYALADVTHLRPVYEKLQRRLARSHRLEWLCDEMAVLASPATYVTQPEDSWKRLKLRPQKPRFMAVLQALCEWREHEAQRRDLPRNFVLRDEAIVELAGNIPTTIEELGRSRGLSKSFADGRQGTEVLAAIAKGRAIPEDQAPVIDARPEAAAGVAPIIELLRVLLKLKCDEHGVAAKLVASAADLEQIASNDHAAVPALSGWRLEVFGIDALALKHGKLALAISDKHVILVPTAAAENMAAVAESDGPKAV